MKKETMSPRERWEAVLNHKKPDRMPIDYWATPEVNIKLMKWLGLESMHDVCKELHIDRPVRVIPEYIGPKKVDLSTDIYGCRYKDIEYNGGIYAECIYNPLADYETVEEIDKNYQWPTVDWFDYSTIKEQIKGKEEYPVGGGGSEPFLWYKRLRGEEQAYVDLVMKPEIVDHCLDKLFDFCYENTERIYEQIPGKVTYSYVAEDLGGETGLLYSPEHIRKYFLPRMKRMMDLAHSSGVFVFNHSDGAIRDIIPDFINAGIDILNPIQWRCSGMEREGLKKDFGKDVIFHGGVDNQYTLPFGSTDEVRKEVRENIRIFGKGGGYILAPCHNIQAVSPVENIIAMYKEGYDLSWDV
jgi:uroporphyrinogen decarboxylase